eukprot:TRINITY_DN6043_c0_g1_i3.p1 TRINITY_DN6043_c0_g1~~TRINITY_DN6043_c0_g1_i3.p1  ORF type:complete len:103 (-),score=3.43 TRINITY_DN6043_c0_g1_i3:59-367(-)
MQRHDPVGAQDCYIHSPRMLPRCGGHSKGPVRACGIAASNSSAQGSARDWSALVDSLAAAAGGSAFVPHLQTHVLWPYRLMAHTIATTTASESYQDAGAGAR